ncbi:MAG: hypothetical protein ACRD0A_01920 [Acidimicrobiales bacterium]
MDDVESIERAIAALEAQRPSLGDDVVDTATAPLREKRATLVARMTGEQRKLVTVVSRPGPSGSGPRHAPSVWDRTVKSTSSKGRHAREGSGPATCC